MRIDDGKVEYFKKSLIIDALIYLYVFAIHIFTYRPGLNIISNVLFLILTGSMLYYLFFKCGGGRVYFDKLLGIFAIFTFLSMASITYSELKASASSRVRTLVFIWIMMFVLYNYLINTGNYKVVVYALLVGGIGYCIYIPLFYGFSDYSKLLSAGERIGTEIANVNSIGMNIAITFSICIYLALFKGKKYMYLLSILPVYIILGTGSRTAILAVAAIAVFLLVANYLDKKTMSSLVKIIALFILAVIVAQIVLSLPMFEDLNERLQTLMNLFSGKGPVDNSARIRNNMIKYGLEEFKSNPFLGHGINNSGILTLKHFGRVTYLHNNYVELLYTVGIFGFAAYYAMYVYLIKKLYKLFKRKVEFAELFLIDLLVYLIMDYGTVSYYDKEPYIFFIAAAVFIRLNEKNSEIRSDNCDNTKKN